MRCEMRCALLDDDGLTDERPFDRCGRNSAHGILSYWGAKPQWLLRVQRGRKVTGHGRRDVESCSRSQVWVAGIWSSCGKLLEILHSDWRENLLIGAIALTVMAVVHAVLE